MATEPTHLTLATRGSALALRQAELARAYLRGRFPRVGIELKIIKTSGDRQAGWSLEKEGGAGLFTAEVERAVAEGGADIAVHSAKDLPTTLPEGLSLAGFLPREAVHDVLILRRGIGTPRTIATGSPRRRAQAKRFFPTAVWKELRGNVEGRLKKIASGEADATFLAAAGLRRLGIHSFEGLVFCPLDVRQMIPAPAQGAVALQTTIETAEKLGPLGCPRTAHAVTVERALLRALGGGCHSAWAAHWCNGRLWSFGEDRGAAVHECGEPPGEALRARIEAIAKSLAPE